MTKSKPLAERFREKVAAKNEAGCELWLAGKSHGYGRIRVDGRSLFAHRLAWELAHGPIAPDLCVLHRCDTPACVNVDHLFIGTHDDNMADRSSKGRCASAQGVLNNRARLRECDVLAIFEDSGLQREIAKRFGITQVHVSQIKRGVCWAHVTGAAA